MAKPLDKAKDSALFLKKNWQVIYAMLLILLVPIAIVSNTLFVTNRFRTTIDAELQRTAMIIGKMIGATSRDLYDDQAAVQQRLEVVAKALPEVHSLDILNKDGEDFRVYASLDASGIGLPAHGTHNILSWYNNQAIAYLTKSGRSAAAEEILTPEEVRSTERFWSVIMPLADSAGEKRFLLSAKISLATIDDMVTDNLFWSYAWLAITVLIVILVLASNTRLFEYAVLFRKLKEVDKMKDDFISMASHELRAPITAIRGYLSLFLEDAFGKMEDKPKGILKTVFGISTHLAGLVEDLLDVSRIEQGRMKMTLELLPIEEVIREVMEQMQFEAEKKKLAFIFKPPEQPLPRIEADRSRLKQILINIVSNAIKYTPSGSITITAATHEGGKVETRIIDTGLGMSAEQREKLFSKFYRVKTDATRDIPGTGLGLWITKQIVELMKGSIYVDSIERVGTQVALVFPQAATAPAPAAPAAAPATPAASPTAPVVPAKPASSGSRLPASGSQPSTPSAASVAAASVQLPRPTTSTTATIPPLPDKPKT